MGSRSRSASSRRTAVARRRRWSTVLSRSRARASNTEGVVIEEMNTAAIIERRPEIVVVDEIAHTNAPGSRNKRRYQDVLEILDAGISVSNPPRPLNVGPLGRVSSPPVSSKSATPEQHFRIWRRVFSLDAGVKADFGPDEQLGRLTRCKGRSRRVTGRSRACAGPRCPCTIGTRRSRPGREDGPPATRGRDDAGSPATEKAPDDQDEPEARRCTSPATRAPPHGGRTRAPVAASPCKSGTSSDEADGHDGANSHRAQLMQASLP